MIASLLTKRTLAKFSRPESDAGCWLWVGSRTRDGYGLVVVQRSMRRVAHLAHRIAWEMHNGPIPDGACVCHRCDQPLCIRPDHLFLGTHTENMRDAAAKGRTHRQRKPRIPDTTRDAVRRESEAGATAGQLVARHRIALVTVKRILRERR